VRRLSPAALISPTPVATSTAAATLSTDVRFFARSMPLQAQNVSQSVAFRWFVSISTFSSACLNTILNVWKKWSLVHEICCQHHAVFRSANWTAVWQQNRISETAVRKNLTRKAVPNQSTRWRYNSEGRGFDSRWCH